MTFRTFGSGIVAIGTTPMYLGGCPGRLFQGRLGFFPMTFCAAFILMAISTFTLKQQMKFVIKCNNRTQLIPGMENLFIRF